MMANAVRHSSVKTERSSRLGIDRTALTVLALASLLAGGFVYYATRWGPSVFSDSAVYFNIGKNIALGRGYVVISPSGNIDPITQQVPVYPILLGVFNILRLDPVIGARWLDIALAVLTVFVCGWVFKKSSSLALAAIPVALVVLGLPTLIPNYSMAGTEAPFVLLTLLGIILLIVYLQTLNMAALLGSIACAGLAVVTRYSGVFMPPLGALLILVFLQAPWQKRLSLSVLYGLLASIPLAIWILWVRTAPGAHSPFQLPDTETFWQYLGPFRSSFLGVVWSWLPFGDRSSSLSYNSQRNTILIIAVLWILLLVLSMWKLHRQRTITLLRDPDVQLVVTFGMGALFFTGFFVLSYLIDWAPPDVSSRTLLALHFLLILAFFASLALICKAWLLNKRMLSLLLVFGAGVMILFSYLPQSWEAAQTLHEAGAGYTSLAWQNSETIQAVKRLPTNMLVISNDTGAILFFTGRSALEINELYSPKPAERFLRYGDDPQDGSEVYFKQGKAVLVVFNGQFHWQIQAKYGNLADQRLDTIFTGLKVAGQYTDGTIYAAP
jgi:hypothetical protein